MKKYTKMNLYFYVFVCSILMLNATENFEFTPTYFDLKGLETKGDTIVAYGNYGSALISNNGGESWNKIKPFTSENIINFFINKSELIAFSHSGLVSVSEDQGNTWEDVYTFNDSLINVIYEDRRFFARTNNSLVKLSEDFTNIKENSLGYSNLNYSGDVSFIYRDNLTYLNDFIYVIDSSKIKKYDSELQLIDSVSSDELGVCSNCTITALYSDSLNLYSRIKGVLYKIKELKFAESVINLSKKLIENTYIHYFDIIDSKKYALNYFMNEQNRGPYFKIFEIIDSNNIIKIDEIDCSRLSSSGPSIEGYNDFSIEDNQLTIVSNQNFISTKTLGTDKTNKVSDLKGFSIYNDPMPYVINDSTLLYLSDERIYESKDYGITIQHVKGDTAVFESEDKFRIQFSYFDEEENKLYYVVNSSYDYKDTRILISENYGLDFYSKPLDNLELFSSTRFSNFQINKNNYIFSVSARGDHITNWIYFYDKGFKLQEKLIDTNYYIRHIYASNKEEYTLLSDSKLSENYEQDTYIKYTVDQGMSWDTLRKYESYTDTLWNEDSTDYNLIGESSLKNFQGINIQDNLNWFITSYTRTDSILKVELFDVKNRNIETLFQRKINKDRNTAITSYEDTVYIAYGDTLFYLHAEHLYNSEKWDHYVFPNNGKIWSGKLKRYGDRLLALYEDEKRQMNLYWFKLPDDITSVEENKTEIKPYLYTDKPYPIPAGNSVTTEIYWDINFIMQKANIGVYDVKGNRIEGDENININSQSNWPGKLTWDCSQVSDGIYFIVIEYGQTSKSIPVIKSSNK